MNKREKFIALEFSGENLDQFVSDLKDKILSEFWPEIPQGENRNQIEARLEKSILNALKPENE